MTPVNFRLHISATRLNTLDLNDAPWLLGVPIAPLLAVPVTPLIDPGDDVVDGTNDISSWSFFGWLEIAGRVVRNHSAT